MEVKIADLFNQGQDLFEMGQYDKSIEIINILKDNQVELKDVHYLLAQNYLHKLLALKRANSGSYINPVQKMEVQKEEAGLYNLAFENCKKSIELYNFQDKDGFFCMGEIFRVGGDLRSALLNYIRAKQLGDFEASRRLEEVKIKEHNSQLIIEELSRNINSFQNKVKAD